MVPQYSPPVLKTVPYLRELEEAIDNFRGNLMDDILKESCLQEQIPQLQGEKPIEIPYDLSAFPYVLKLLTGELLGHEQPLDYHAKIEPIIRHEIPEIPGTSSSSTQLKGNIIPVDKPLENCGNTAQATNDADINDGTLQLYEERDMASYCESRQQYSDKSTVTSEMLSQNYLKSGANVVKHRRINSCPPNYIVGMEVNTGNGKKKLLPEIQPKPLPGKEGTSLITTSVRVMDNAERETMLQNLGHSSRRNVNAAVRTGRTREKQKPRATRWSGVAGSKR
jgi:hypothetical protein